MTTNEITQQLAYFTGTEAYHRHQRNLVLTDGVKFLADNAKCYWLLDVVWSYLPKVIAEMQASGNTFYVVRYVGTPGASGTFALTDDIPAKVLIASQEVAYSDFPLNEIKLYLSPLDETNWVLMLPSEY